MHDTINFPSTVNFLIKRQGDNTMDSIKTVSLRVLLILLFFMSLLCALINVGVYMSLDRISPHIETLNKAPGDFSEIRDVAQKATDAGDMVRAYMLPVSAGIFLLLTLLMWISVRAGVASVLKKRKLEHSRPVAVKKDVAPDEERRVKDQRLFLHMLSTLQREGRLMDFFSEDLENYEDEQIGAAVRSIHENCVKVISKYVTADAILNEEEGDEITIPPGFDANAIKLTGNVSGDPPFKGIVQHKGWKADKIDLPKLSAHQGAAIISPAEVEVL